MNSVAILPTEDRADLFRQSARKAEVPPLLIEKDFWVSWTLKQLFSIEEFKGNILFKGGTSLSKVFDLIKRFSEDIDIGINHLMLGFTGPRDPASDDLSTSKRHSLLKEMHVECRAYVEGTFLTALRLRFEHVLQSRETWKLEARRVDEESSVIEFHYPSALTSSETLGYVRPVVLLEPGAHTELSPAGNYFIRPIAAEFYPHVFSEPNSAVVALKAERTFWEKATILHAEYFRPTSKELRPRYSRHYYDLARLGESQVLESALAEPSLLKRVVEHKRRFYSSAWANYDMAVPGSFRVVPPEYRLPGLKRDYLAMREMIFGTAPSFDDILSTLRNLEQRINNLEK